MLRGVGNSMGIGRNWYKIIEQTHRTRQPEGCGRRYVPLPWEPWGDSAKAPLRLDCAQASRLYVCMFYTLSMCAWVSRWYCVRLYAGIRESATWPRLHPRFTRRAHCPIFPCVCCTLSVDYPQLSTYHRKDQLHTLKNISCVWRCRFPFFP